MRRVRLVASRDAVASAVRQRNVRGVLQLLFEGDLPVLRRGYRTETELWDFKADCPIIGRDADNAWAEFALDILAFHNNQGGVIFFGISDAFEFVGANTRLDSKMVNDRLRQYLPDTIWVEYYREFIQSDQRYLGVALVSPRGPLPRAFRSAAPTIAGKQRFGKGWSARREHDSSLVLDPTKYNEWVRGLQVPIVSGEYVVDLPQFRILQPDYQSFIERPAVGAEIEKALVDPRTAVTSLVGLGGMGKTALATWAVLRAYERKQFEFIVSVTAKDRELTSTGILGIDNTLSTFEDLLDSIAEVLDFPDLKQDPVKDREASVRLLLESGSGLLFVDNLETVDDARVIAFLDSLPMGTRAVTTSRRTRVRVAVNPVDVGAMKIDEVVRYAESLLELPSFAHLGTLRRAELERIGAAWEGVPLAIRWALSRCKSASEAISSAEHAQTPGRHGDELLEFSFRRVFDALTPFERAVMEVLSTLQKPLPIEALVAGCGQTQEATIDAVDDLSRDALVQRVFDPTRNDYCYTVMPLTKSFVQRNLSHTPNVSSRIQKNLSEWFDARDVGDDKQRLVVRELRKGGQVDDSALVDLAVSAQKRGDNAGAEALFTQALGRNPRSWKAARLAGEFYRHVRQNPVETLRYYRLAVSNAPARGSDRALIMREYGLLVRDSGEPDASGTAEEALMAALVETPNDQIALAALAALFDKRGAHRKVIELLESHLMGESGRFSKLAGPLLLRAYEKTMEIGKAAVLRRAMNPTDED